MGQRVLLGRAQLRQEGFQTDAAPKTSDRPKGEVIGQDPSGGSQADKGSTVTLTVSDGPAQVRVPPVVGVSADAAKSRLKKAGLKAQGSRQSSDSVPKGIVISASPDEGSTVDVGSTVALTVSNGPQKVSVPDVSGRTFDDASAQLQSAGLQVTRKDQESQDRPEGTVLSQSPSGGTSVDKGATVSLTVAKAPAAQVVPLSALQMLKAEAIVFVRNAEGFEARRVTVGRRDARVVEITAGLTVGERIATSNTFILKADLGKSELDHED